MKKFFIFFFVVVIVATLFSCQTKTVDTKTVVKTTVKEIGSEGFILKKVVKGDTVWGYSDEAYGTGLQWREIVAENPFLNESGRVYYDQGIKEIDNDLTELDQADKEAEVDIEKLMMEEAENITEEENEIEANPQKTE